MKQTISAILALIGAHSVFAADLQVPYPDGYRDWRHVKSMVIEQGHPLFDKFGGIHHLYANKEAMEGYGAGHFPDGAVIVFDLLEAIRANAAITEGKRKVVGVMHKDEKNYAGTGGWGFEGFAAGDPSQRVVKENAKTACFDCHAAQKDHDFVFSTPRD